MIGLGWLTMPTLLAASLRRPLLRYLLAVPATFVWIGLLATTVMFDGGGWALVGWWMITAGIGLGAMMGMWLWFRWLPVPRQLDEPFSNARWSLIGVHVALVVFGVVFVFLGGVG